MRLRHRLALGVGDDARDVLRLGDDGRAPGAHQRVAHLVRHLLERVAHHLHRDEVAHRRLSFAPLSGTKSPRSRPTCAAWPGGISVAEVGSSMTAGPFTRMPWRSF